MIVDRKSHSIVFDTCHDKPTLKTWQANFDTYTKLQLKAIFSLFASRLSGYTVHMSGSITRIKFGEMLKNYAKNKKEGFVNVLAGIFAEKSNRAIILDLLTPEQKQMWSDIFKNIYLSESQCNDYFKKAIFPRSKYYYREYQEITDEAAWLVPLSFYNHWDYSTYVYLPAFVRAAFEEYIIPGGNLGAQLVGGATDAPVETTNFETSTLELLPLLNGLYLSGKIESGRFRVSLTVVKRLAKQLKIQEFACDKNDEMGQYLRTMMLVNAYSIFADSALLRRNKAPRKTYATVREIYKTLLANAGSLNGVFLSFLNKSTAKVLEWSSVKGVWTILTDKLTASKGEPVTAADLFDALYFMDGSSQNVTVLSNDCLGSNDVQNTRTGRTINLSNFLSQVTVPVMLASVAMLASLGIIEASYVKVAPDSPYPLSGLRSVKLTPLGAYALGFTEKYSNPDIQERVYFEADENSLVIRALEENNPYEGMMAEYCRSIGARRWLLTPETFLDKCRDKSDLTKKIADFRMLTGITLPKIFDDYFQRLQDNCDWAVDLEDRYAIFQLNPEATDLIDALVSDPEMRSIVTRAEGYKILVPVHKLDSLAKCFRKYGYIL